MIGGKLPPPPPSGARRLASRVRQRAAALGRFRSEGRRHARAPRSSVRKRDVSIQGRSVDMTSFYF